MTDHISSEEISAFVDSEETETQATQIEEHLRVCAGCSAESAHLSLVKKLVARSAEAHVAPEELFAAALARIDGNASVRALPGMTWRRTLIPAFAVLFITAALLIGRMYNGTPEGWLLSCEECQELLPHYIAHGLAPAEHRLVAAHLEVCTICRVAYKKMLAGSKVAALPADIWPNEILIPDPPWTRESPYGAAWVALAQEDVWPE